MAASSLHGTVVIDGTANSGESYVNLGATQTQSSYIDNSVVLASIRYFKAANTLNLAICGRATNTAILVFIDAVPGGVTRITPNLIAPQTGEEHEFINKLAFDETVGLTFESGFTPETAIRIFGNEDDEGVKTAHVNRFNLLTGTHAYVGESHAAAVSEGPIRSLRTSWVNVGSGTGINGYDSHRKGVEMDLNLAALGVTGTGKTLKLMAIMVSGMLQDDPETPAYIEGSNQALAPVGSFMADINQFNFGSESEPDLQTLTLEVDGLDPAGDEDNDGLLNGVETSTGIYVNATNTGSNPVAPDTDGDGYPDGAEVTGSATLGLGYVSDPNKKNYGNMAVPGSFNQPTTWNANASTNSPSNAMVQESTSLTGQYRWNLDYKFPSTQLGEVSYKFTTGGSFAIQWSASNEPGIAVMTDTTSITGNVPASGIHRFSFDQITLAYSFSRTVFANSTAFLAAYGLTAGIDSDADGILNENEFTANTDPTNPDSDSDGYSDKADGMPLVAITSGGGYAGWAAGLISGNQAASADPDGDGFTNYQEFLFGTAPGVPGGMPTPMERSGGNLVIRWLQRTSGVSYQLQETTTFAENPWPASSAAIITDSDQSNVPTGYIRKKASVPTNQPRRFLRIHAHD
jgi:hypothetical protein